MQKIVCDRCGADIVAIPQLAAHFPNYCLSVIQNARCQVRHLDLCLDCMNKLNDWIKDKTICIDENEYNELKDIRQKYIKQESINKVPFPWHKNNWSNI